MKNQNYPPFEVLQSSYVKQSQKKAFNILQLTDLHLRLDKQGRVDNTRLKNIKSLLNHALVEMPECDLILVTGDLAHDIDKRVYDALFEMFTQLGIPFAWIAGNHDVTDEVGGDDIPFEDKTLVAYEADKRLLNQYCIHTENWNLLLLDSTDPGQISGQLSEKDLFWLKQQLTDSDKPTIICMHHHPISIQSDWIDQHMLLNAEEFWQTIEPFNQIKAILFGHIHQAFYHEYKEIALFATPSTAYQFKPNSEQFALDKKHPGYRLLTLYADGTIESEVKRCDQSV